jgi:hypothetical protein
MLMVYCVQGAIIENVSLLEKVWILLCCRAGGTVERGKQESRFALHVAPTR